MTTASAPRHLSRFDRLLDDAQRALETVLGAPVAERPNPGAGEPEIFSDQGYEKRAWRNFSSIGEYTAYRLARYIFLISC